VVAAAAVVCAVACKNKRAAVFLCEKGKKQREPRQMSTRTHHSVLFGRDRRHGCKQVCIPMYKMEQRDAAAAAPAPAPPASVAAATAKTATSKTHAHSDKWC